MAPLHSPATVFSLRHAPSWLLLAFSAGAVNAIAYLACSRFVTHVTGTVTNIGMDATSVRLALDYAAVLACFVAGAMSSAVLIDARHHQGKSPLYPVPLVAVALVLAAVGAAGLLGAFGTFGGSVEGPRDFAFLSIVAFAMGLQNAAVATSTGMLVRTTHMTGPATDLGVHLATAYYAAGSQRATALRHAGLRFGKIAAFVSGAAAGAALARTFHYGSFFVPAAVVGLATLLSFVPLRAAEPIPEVVS
jgi:uncharacterized membrane protein YoaK (UPF0700 family)